MGNRMDMEEFKNFLRSQITEIIGEQISKEFDSERDARNYMPSILGGGSGCRAQGSTDGFNSFGEFLVKVYDAGHGKGWDERLQTKEGMSEGVDSEGGFTVPEQFRNEILRVAQESAIVRPRAQIFPMESDLLTIPRCDETDRSSSIYGGVVAYWVAEGATGTVKEPKFGQLALRPKKLMGLTYATSELVADSKALEKFLYQVFADALVFYEEDAFWQGTGVGQPVGILGASCVKTIPKETSPAQAAATIVTKNLAKMYAGMVPSALKRAIWVISPSMVPELFDLKSKVLNQGGTDWVGGSPFFVSGAQESPNMTIYGRPVFVSEHLNVLGQEGDIVFLDPKGYVIGNRTELKIDSSIHVAFTSDKIYFRFIRRVDAQPILTSEITLKDGATTVSPFVTLAIRE